MSIRNNSLESTKRTPERAVALAAPRPLVRWWFELLADLVFVLCASTVFLGLVSLVSATEPKVQFDVGYLVPCVELPTPAFSAVNPRLKLVEARFQVSSFIVLGKEEDVTQHVYRFEGTQGTSQIHDYVPKTTLETRYAGPIGVQQGEDNGNSLSVNLLGKYEAITGTTMLADLHQKNTSQTRYELLPPLEAVAASGTLNRGRSVFFKLRGNDRTWMEGTKEFALILAVPLDWQADYLRVRCEAEGVRRVSGKDEKFVCGQRDFLVGLHREGDEAARAAAYQLVAAEAQLRKQATLSWAAQERHRQSHPLEKFAQSLSGKEPKSPLEWLPQVTWANDAGALQQVPKEIRPAAEQFRTARQQVARLGGGRTL